MIPQDPNKEATSEHTTRQPKHLIAVFFGLRWLATATQNGKKSKKIASRRLPVPMLQGVA